MSVVIISRTSAIVVTEKIGEPQYLLHVFRGHYRYKAVVVKCDHRNVAFYRDTLRDAEEKEGRVERFLDYIKRQGLDLVIVEKDESSHTKISYIRPDNTRYEVTQPAVIVKVDDSVDPLIAQRAMDVWATNSRHTPHPTELVHEIEHLVERGMLPGKLTEIKFEV